MLNTLIEGWIGQAILGAVALCEKEYGDET